jgi:hypothetical protein
MTFYYKYTYTILFSITQTTKKKKRKNDIYRLPYKIFTFTTLNVTI